jgi:lysophospholipase L1-like esterase
VAPPRFVARGLRVLLFVVYLVVVLELGARAFWWLAHDVPFLSDPDDWIAVVYPGFRGTGPGGAELGARDAALDVLLLGGSVLHDLARDHGEELRASLVEATGRSVRLHDFARAAHTSRDSLLKSRLLTHAPLDLVVVYHGINDARMNNAPPGMFRDDYGHAQWYAKVEALLAAAPQLPLLALPTTIRFMAINLLKQDVFGRYVPRHAPNRAWTRYGGEIRTEGSFRDNLQGIVDLAGERGQRVLLMSFAWHLPPDYTRERFLAKELDYAAHRHATGIWGEPDHVARALEVHNRVIRTLPRPSHLIFAEVEASLPRDAAHFDDVCHLTDEGERIWLEALARAVELAYRPAPTDSSAGSP